MNYPKNRYTGPKPWMDKDWLYNEYVIKNRGSQEIADEYGCKQNTIQCWLLKFQIKKEDPRIKKPYQTYEYLYQKYIEEKISRDELSQLHGVSIGTITEWLQFHHIDLWDNSRKFSVADVETICKLYTEQKMSSTQIGEKYQVSHRTILLLLQKQGIKRRSLSDSQFAAQDKDRIPELYDKDYLYRLHWVENKSCKEIGQMLGCDAGIVRKHMHDLGLETKNNSQSKIGQLVGEKHPNWKGGVTALDMLLREFFQVNLASKAVKRDQCKCQLCGAQTHKLHVHHIKHFADIVQEIRNEHPDLCVGDPDDKQKLYEIITHDPRFLDMDNLITLCKTCHIQIHKQEKENSKTISSQA